MSHVNRKDRMSRRLLGFTGRCEAVEAHNKVLAAKVADLEVGQSAFIKMLATYQEALVQAREQIAALTERITTAETLFIAKAEPLPGFSDACSLPEAVESVDSPEPV